jgi:hypothetical protein
MVMRVPSVGKRHMARLCCEKAGKVYVSSNRDESRYDDPDRFDVTRNPEHQAFGAGGRHFCLGASLALCDYPFDLVAEVIRSQFKGKRSEVGELNVRAARLAFEHVKQNESAKDFPYTLKPGAEPKARILAKGYEIAASEPAPEWGDSIASSSLRASAAARSSGTPPCCSITMPASRSSKRRASPGR